MAEYTYKDIIIDPTSEEAKNAIGKEVFYADTPLGCIEYANNNIIYFLGVLDEIQEKYYPFLIRKNGEWACIIVKKEEPKAKYVPFSNWEDFMDAYISCLERNKEDTGREAFLANHGIWLYNKFSNGLVCVINFYDDGVVLSGRELFVDDNGYASYETVEWKTLLDICDFMDGSPCGKEVEE